MGAVLRDKLTANFLETGGFSWTAFGEKSGREGKVGTPFSERTDVLWLFPSLTCLDRSLVVARMKYQVWSILGALVCLYPAATDVPTQPHLVPEQVMAKVPLGWGLGDSSSFAKWCECCLPTKRGDFLLPTSVPLNQPCQRRPGLLLEGQPQRGSDLCAGGDNMWKLPAVALRCFQQSRNFLF